jgi:hypothetical protein
MSQEQNTLQEQAEELSRVAKKVNTAKETKQKMIALQELIELSNRAVYIGVVPIKK